MMKPYRCEAETINSGRCLKDAILSGLCHLHLRKVQGSKREIKQKKGEKLWQRIQKDMN